MESLNIKANFLDSEESSGFDVDLTPGQESQLPSTTEAVADDVMIADSLGLYLHQMAKVKDRLLTRQEEVELAKRIEKGDFDAKTELIEYNLKLVVSIASKRTDDSDKLLEMIQDGSTGLIRAAEKFDWRKGFKFSTYATWWIKQSIQRGQENTASTIRLPVHIGGQIRKIQRVQREYFVEHGVMPSLEETAVLAEMEGPAEVQALLDYDAFVKIVSLDSPVGDENDNQNASIGDFVQDRSADVEGEIEAEMNTSTLDLMMAYCLSPIEIKVIAMRYGTHEYDRPYTLVEIGKHIGITRERVRQIEQAALNRLESYALATNMIEKAKE